MQRYLSAAILGVAFSMPFPANDFAIRGSGWENFLVEDIKQVVLECTCSGKITITRSNDSVVKVRFAAVLDSVGYHGERSTLVEIPKKHMGLDSRVSGQMLYLSTREWTFVHTAFILEDIELEIPSGVEFRTLLIPFKELEGRHLK